MASPYRLLRKFQTLTRGFSWTRSFASRTSEKKEQKDNSTQAANKLDVPVEQQFPVQDPPPDLPNPVRNTEREYYETHLNPKWKGHGRSVFDNRFYSKKHGFTKKFTKLLYWDMNIDDIDELKIAAEANEYNKLKENQRYSDKRVKAVGPELGAAHFVVARGGAVKFVGRDSWFRLDTQGKNYLPRTYVENLYVEAIDASNTKLTYVAFDNFEELAALRYIKFQNCPYIDDWCLARLQRLRHSLEFLHVQDCPFVSDCGLASLHCLENLQALQVSGLNRVEHIGLLTLLLEEHIPGLTILGVKEEELSPPAWLHRGERKLVRALLGTLDSYSVESEDFQFHGIAGGIGAREEIRRNIKKVED